MFTGSLIMFEYCLCTFTGKHVRQCEFALFSSRFKSFTVFQHDRSICYTVFFLRYLHVPFNLYRNYHAPTCGYGLYLLESRFCMCTLFLVLQKNTCGRHSIRKEFRCFAKGNFGSFWSFVIASFLRVLNSLINGCFVHASA